MKYLRIYENFDEREISDICLKYGIKNYTVNSDGSIDVRGMVDRNNCVDLSDLNIQNIPLEFNIIRGNFLIHNNPLVSLKNSPNHVFGNFSCDNCQLNSLEYSPKYVGGTFNCRNNDLKTLKGSPEYVGLVLNCDNNILRDVYGCTDKGLIIIYLKGNPVEEIINLAYQMRVKFIKYLNEYEVIHDNRIFEDGLDQAYYMTTKEELTLEQKNFKHYILF